MTSFILKIIAMITMLIDHIGAVFFPITQLISQNTIWRIIGRLSFPIFAFQLGIGYKHTKNKEKHILTMLIFALISQLPYSLALDTKTLNIGFTFLISILIIYSIEKFKSYALKILSTILLLYLGIILNIDYGIYGIALCVGLYYAQNSKILTTSILFSFTLLHTILMKNLTMIFAIMSIIPIILYNKKQGKKTKWPFYIFYPAHLLALYLIKIFI